MDNTTFQQQIRTSLFAPAITAMRAEELRGEIARVTEDLKSATNRHDGAALWDKLINLNVRLIKLERAGAGLFSGSSTGDVDAVNSGAAVWRGRAA